MKRLMFLARLLVLYPIVAAGVGYCVIFLAKPLVGIRLEPVVGVVVALFVWYASILFYARSFIHKIMGMR